MPFFHVSVVSKQDLYRSTCTTLHFYWFIDDTTTMLFTLPTEIALLLVADDSLVHTDFHLFRFLLPLASKYSQLCFCENSRKLRLILPEVEEIVNYSSHTLVLRLI